MCISIPPASLPPTRSYGFMLAVYVILAIVVSCVTVVSTYFLLNAEGEGGRRGR